VNKFVLFSLIGIFLFSTGFSALTDNLIAWYNMDENTGTSVADEVGTNDLFLNGSLWNNEGIDNHALNFSRTASLINKYAISTSNIGITGNDAFSISTWIYPLSWEANSVLWNLGIPGTAGHIIGLNMELDGGTKVIDIQGWGLAGTGTGLSTNIEANLNEWLHIVFTYNGTGWKMYINGIFKNQAMSTFAIDNATIKLNYLGDAFLGRGMNARSDLLGVWSREISAGEVTTLWNSGNSYNPYAFTITDYNVSKIFDNSTTHSFGFNKSVNLLFTGYNSTDLTPQSLTMNITDLDINVNVISNVNYGVTFNNVSVTNYSVLVYNPFDVTVNTTAYFTINDVKNITLMNTTTFYKDNTTQSLNFSIYLNDGNITCDDYFNLTIPSAGINNKLIKSCELTSVTFNNSAVYNYTSYLTNNRFGRTINNTVNFYTNVYNISSVTYSSLPLNGSYTTITENVGTRMSGTGQTYITYIERNGTNYTNPNYYLANTNLAIEIIPFTAWLNVSYEGISYLYSETHNQTITNIILAKCNANYTYNFLNTSFKEEITRTAINMTLAEKINFEITLTPTGTETDLFYTFTETINTTTTINLCSNYPLSNFTFDSVLKYYTNDGYGYEETLNNWRPRNHFYLSDIIGTNSTKTQNLYLLLEANSQIETFTVKDEDDNYLKGYYITLQRAYGGIYTTSNFETVAMMLVGEDGKATTYVDNTAFYIIKIFTPAGTLYYTSNAFQFGIDTTYSLTASSGTGTTYLASVGNYQTNALLNLSSCIITLNALNTGFSEFDHKTKIMMTNGTIIEETGTTSELTQAILIPDCTAKSYWIILTVSDDNNDNLLLFKQYVDNTDYYDYSDMGVFLTFIMIAGMGTAGLLVNPKLIPVLSVIGLIVSSIVGLMPISWIVLSGLLIGSILLIWVIK